MGSITSGPGRAQLVVYAYEAGLIRPGWLT